MTIWPSSNATRISWPSTRLRTVDGVAAASPCRARSGRRRGCPGGRERRGRDSRGATDRRGRPARPRALGLADFAVSAGRKPAYQIAAPTAATARTTIAAIAAPRRRRPDPAAGAPGGAAAGASVRVRGVRHGIVGMRPSLRFDQPPSAGEAVVHYRVGGVPEGPSGPNRSRDSPGTRTRDRSARRRGAAAPAARPRI